MPIALAAANAAFLCALLVAGHPNRDRVGLGVLGFILRVIVSQERGATPGEENGGTGIQTATGGGGLRGLYRRQIVIDDML